ncbi:MAG: T9SS type A sorting domain-containing protein [Chitinophagaceae bacterium]
MKIKRLCFFLSVILTSSLYSQNNALESKAQSDCENLIFNTKELTPFEFNERCRTESYPFLSEDGIDLYYTHDQAYDWLFYSQREQSTGKWTVPVPLQISNFKDKIRSCYLSQDKSELYFISQDKLYKCRSIEGSRTEFGNVELIEINHGSSVKGPLSYLSFTSDMSRMYAYVNLSGTNTMCEYSKTNDNVYTYLKTISSTKREMGMLSRNGLVYYFTNDIFPNLLFCRKRESLGEDFGLESYLVKSFESHLNVTQLRLAEKAGLMTVVLSESVWNKNDLYFTSFNNSDSAINQYPVFDITNFKAQAAQNRNNETVLKDVSTTLPVKKREVINTKGAELCKIELGQTFPNPAKNTFFFYYYVTSEDQSIPAPVVVVMDNAGRTVYTSTLDELKGEARVILEDVSSGSYMIKVEYNGMSSEIIRVSINL